MQGAEAIDITVGYNIVYLAAQLGDFPSSVIVGITFFGHKNKGDSVFSIRVIQ